MLLKMRYDSLKQKEFFRKIITAYLEDHPLMRELVLELNKEKIKKTSIKKIKKDFERKNDLIKDFALDESEISNIFDILEKENPDI